MSDDAIENLLNEVWDKGYQCHRLTTISRNRVDQVEFRQMATKEAVQQIRQYILDEVIGEDTDLKPLEPLPNLCMKAFGANQLKAEQRKKTMNTITNPKMTMTCTVHGEVTIPHVCKLKITKSGAGLREPKL